MKINKGGSYGRGGICSQVNLKFNTQSNCIATIIAKTNDQISTDSHAEFLQN